MKSKLQDDAQEIVNELKARGLSVQVYTVKSDEYACQVKRPGGGQILGTEPDPVTAYGKTPEQAVHSADVKTRAKWRDIFDAG